MDTYQAKLLVTACLVAFVAACDISPSSNSASSSTPASATPFASASSPPPGHPLVFGWDGVDGRMLMASVESQYGDQPDPTTWTFNGTDWVKAPAAMNAPVVGFMAYDSGRNRQVLVGRTPQSCYAPSCLPFKGYPQARTTISTWEWDGHSWREQTTAHLPGDLNMFSNIAGAYSPELRATVLVRTRDRNGVPTWLFDGTDWRSVETAHQPPAVLQVGYDSTRHSIVALSDNQANYQTWQFDGHDWSPIATIGSATPGGFQVPAAALDQKRDLWVVFGGNIGSYDLDETWTSDGDRWTKQSPTSWPPARSSSAMAWDPSQRQLLMFGGEILNGRGGYNGAGDTWAWDGGAWAHLAGPLPPPVIISRDAPGYPSPRYAGIAAIEDKTGLVYSPDGCTPTQTCLGAPHVFGNPDAFTAAYVQMSYSGSGGTDCFAYVFPDSRGWHYSSPVVCPKHAGFNPVLGGQDHVSGADTCANVRLAPNLSSRVVTCLNNGTVVTIDTDFPRYVDGHIWWSINSHQGWMAHDFLISST